MGGKARKTGGDEAAFEALADQLRSLLDEAAPHANAAKPAGEKRTMPLQASTRPDAFEQLVQEQFARITAQLDTLGKRLDDMPAAPQRPEEVPGYAELKTVLHNLIEHLELAEGRTAEAIGDLREKLDDVARRTAQALQQAESAAGGDAPETRAALQVLEQRIDMLNQRLEDMRASSEESARAYVDTCIGEVEKKIENLQTAAPDSEVLAQMVRQHVEQHTGEQVRQAEQRIASMVARLQGKLEDLAGGVLDVDRLRTDVEQLDTQVREVQQALQGLSARMEEKADRAETQALQQRLDELAAQLQTAHAAEPADDARLHALEEQVLNIRQLVEEALGEPLSMMGEKLAAHDEQIGRLLQLGGAPADNEEHARRIAALEERIAELQQALAEHPQSRDDTEAGSGKEIETLRAGMADLEKFARDSDERTREMMQTVHEALEEVVRRLDALERQEQDAQRQQAERRRQPDRGEQAAGVEALLGEPAPAAASSAASPAQAAPDQPRPEPATTMKDEVAQVVALMQGNTPATPQTGSAAPAVASTGASANAPADSAGVSQAAQQAPAQSTPQDDFIAAARRAAMAASGGNGQASRDSGSRGGFFARFGKRAKAQEQAAEPRMGDAATPAQPTADAADTSNDRKSGGLLGSLAGMRASLLRGKQEDAQPEDAATDQPLDQEEKATANASSRRRLMLAGVVLLSAGAVLMSRLGGQDTQPATPANAPVVQGEAAAPSASGKPATAKPARNAQPATPARDADARKAATGKRTSDASSALLPGSLASTPASRLHTASITGLATAPNANSSSAAMPPDMPQAAAVSGTATAARAAQTLPEGIGPVALRAAALNGDGKAAYVIATNYLRGRGVAPDARKAAEWFRKAADKGVVVAMYRLGVMHERGTGVARDALQARVWYERAAQRGNVRAMHNLAVLLASGKAGQPDYEAAARWFRKAAEHGVRDSQFNLAVLHHRGQGVKNSLADAWFWYAAAARQGDATAAEQAKKLADYLPASALAEARQRLERFTPTPPIRNANAVIIDRPEWRGAPAVSQAAAAGSAALAGGQKLQGKALVAEVQRLLKRIGYDVGAVDGIMGNRTANAIRLFQLQSRMKVTGTPSMELLQRLRQHLGSQPGNA